MKQTMIVLLSSAIAAVFAVSCGIVSAQPPETATAEVTLERLFYKNDLERIEKAAFSPDGERFLVSDGYDGITLWKTLFVTRTRGAHRRL